MDNDLSICFSIHWIIKLLKMDQVVFLPIATESPFFLFPAASPSLCDPFGNTNTIIENEI